jgi:TolB-like protein/DNA-binding winged helix-turn-helix (wHTH) protein/Flp pilus assembly protein TadD
MSDTPRLARRYRFGVFEVDFGLGHVRKHGLRLRLSGQPLQVLRRLVERPGDVVTREELRNELWPADTFVDFEHNLNSAVKRLRAALGDSADSPRFIETLPRRGYRFLVPVEMLHGTEAPDSVVEPDVATPGGAPDTGDAAADPPLSAPGLVRARAPLLGWRRVSAAVAAGISVLVVVWLAGGAGPREATPADSLASIAVLPFENLSGDGSQSYLADGTTEALIAELAQVQSITVISRTSVMRFQGARRPVPEIARELGVRTVLEGSVMRQGDQLRVTAQLVDARTDRHLWAESYDGHIGDLLTFQSRVARAVAREVHATLSPPEEARLARQRTVDPAVQEAYLKARYFWNQRTPDGLSRAIDYFNQALALDSGHAPSEAGLADAYNLLPRYGTTPTRTALLEAKQHALAALALDPDLAEAHAALAKVQHSLDWDWAGAEASFQRAIDSSPGYATAHQWYSVFLLTTGRVDEGIAEAERARALDPLSPVINLHLAYSLSYRDRLDEAEAAIQRALELEPRYANAHFLAGWIHLRRDDPEAARTDFTTAIDLAGNPREYLGGLAAAEVAAGRRDEAQRIVADLESTQTGAEDSGQPLFWALVALGRTDEAFRILERDFENRSVAFYLFDLTNHWFLESLRADPRLRTHYERAGLDVPGRPSQMPTAHPARGE